MKEWKCPRCGTLTTEHPAISRIDNQTKVCPACGVSEALEAFITATQKEKDLEFIKRFSAISIQKLCQENNLNRSNILNGNASPEATRILRDKIIDQLQEITKDLQK